MKKIHKYVGMYSYSAELFHLHCIIQQNLAGYEKIRFIKGGQTQFCLSSAITSLFAFVLISAVDPNTYHNLLNLFDCHSQSFYEQNKIQSRQESLEFRLSVQ